MRFSLSQNGQLTLVDVATYDSLVHPDRVLHPAMVPPGKKPLANVENNGEPDAGTLMLTNVSSYGNTLDGLRGSGKLKIPIHMRKRGRKVRGGREVA